jgi:hypothetical protein
VKYLRWIALAALAGLAGAPPEPVAPAPAPAPPLARGTTPDRRQALTPLSLGSSARLAPTPIATLREAGPPQSSVDVLLVGDGYTAEDLAPGGEFETHVSRCADRLLRETPFHWYRDRFTLRAAGLESRERGCDPSPGEDTFDTALSCHFDHPRGRVLKLGDEAALERVVRDAGPVDLVLVLVNTSRYGGSGSVLRGIEVRGKPLPAPVFAADHAYAIEIALHELGHSLANLTDAYSDASYGGQYPLPRSGDDLPHANATVAGAFEAHSFEALRTSLKWGHFLELPGAGGHAWLHEGAYYRYDAVYRPWPSCRMRDRRAPFCPVCSEELAKAIVETCGETWDDERFHREHPLASWR